MSIQVMKELADEVKPDKQIPRCELLAKVADPRKREPLHYTVKVEGTKYPYSFTVHIDGMIDEFAVSDDIAFGIYLVSIW